MVGVLGWVELVVRYKFWLLLVSVSVMGNFVWVESVVRHKFWWLWTTVDGCFSGKYFWLG